MSRKRFQTLQTTCSALILWTAQPFLLPTVSKQLVTVGVCHVLQSHWHECSMGQLKKNEWIFPPWPVSSENMALVPLVVELRPLNKHPHHTAASRWRSGIFLPRPGFPKLGVSKNHLEALLKYRRLGPQPRESNSVDLGLGLRIWISKFPRWCFLSTGHTLRVFGGAWGPCHHTQRPPGEGKNKVLKSLIVQLSIRTDHVSYSRGRQSDCTMCSGDTEGITWYCRFSPPASSNILSPNSVVLDFPRCHPSMNSFKPKSAMGCTDIQVLMTYYWVL